MKSNTQFTDEQRLLSQLKNGSEKAFTTIFREYSAHLYSVCLKYTANPHEAEELVQEVFARIWTHCGKIDPRRPLLPYVIRIAKNLLVDKARKKLFERAYLRYRQLASEHYTYSTENQVFFNELKTLLEKEVEDMPSRRKAIFNMSRERGLTNAQIAEETGLSVSTVENHMNAALRQLKRQLGSRSTWVLLPILLIL